jgi:hypothetical protein
LSGSGQTSVIRGSANPFFLPDDNSMHVFDAHDLTFAATNGNSILRSRKTWFTTNPTVLMRDCYLNQEGDAGTLLHFQAGGARITRCYFAGNPFVPRNEAVAVSITQAGQDYAQGYVFEGCHFGTLQAAFVGTAEKWELFAGLSLRGCTFLFVEEVAHLVNHNALLVEGCMIDQVPTPFVLYNVSPATFANNYVGGTSTNGSPLLYGDPESFAWLLTGNQFARYLEPYGPAIHLESRGLLTEKANSFGGYIRPNVQRPGRTRS